MTSGLPSGQLAGGLTVGPPQPLTQESWYQIWIRFHLGPSGQYDWSICQLLGKMSVASLPKKASIQFLSYFHDGDIIVFYVELIVLTLSHTGEHHPALLSIY